MNCWDCMKIQSFCTAKETIDKTKGQLVEWEKIFANDILDTGQYPKSIKNLPNSTHEKQIIKTWEKDMNRYFSKGDIQMASI